MDIYKEKRDSTITMRIIGRIDTITAPILAQELNNCYSRCSRLILDFADVTYISSVGLRILLLAQKIMTGKDGMKIIHVNADVMEIFEITAFSDFLFIA